MPKKMPDPTAQEIASLLDTKSQTKIGEATTELFDKHGLESCVPTFVEAYSKIRNAAGRNCILFWLVRFARINADVVDLAKEALHDPAYMPRMQACGILAYSLQRGVVPCLRPLLSHKHAKTRRDAAAAINAIEKQNHHLFLDRNETGRMFWIVNRETETMA